VVAAIKEVAAPALEDIRAARVRIAGSIFRTPLVRLNVDNAPAEIYLKLENLQPIGSFKIRGASNAIRMLPREKLGDGVYTASAGNMGQGVALGARQLGVPCRVVVPDHAPQTKLDAMTRFGAEIIRKSYDEWWQVMMSHHLDGVPGVFIHPVSDAGVIAGNATIGLEILEDLPDVDTVLVPYGGGGLSCGIAVALREMKSPAKVFPCESESAGPLAAALAVGRPRMLDPKPGFVDGVGGKSVLEEMWPLASSLFHASLKASVAEIAGAIRVIAERNRVIAEGAGAVATAIALAGRAGGGKIVCVVSGGNLDAEKLAVILRGGVPGSDERIVTND
jgi:threonine dehydratase